MGTLNAISYDELEGSGRLLYTPDGIVGHRVFVVDWDDRIEFCRALLGYTRAVGHTPVRTRAQRYPGYDYLYCQRADCTGLGQAGAGAEMIGYSKAKVLAEYSPLNLGSSNSEDDSFDADEEDSGLHLEEVWDFAAGTVAVPGAHFTYSDTGESPYESVGVVVGTVELTLSSENEPELGKAAIRSCLGKVNAFAWYGASAEHVLFTGASARRVVTSEGERAWRVSYRFRERMVSWNKSLRGNTWVELIPKPYGTTNFSVLF